ncbi:MAG: hypothetical protein COA78_28755 [Blastopirellula sp.]|nr:MAG: hypothetical protein COA78_28755 [Blastopirellula sp.]
MIRLISYCALLILLCLTSFHNVSAEESKSTSDSLNSKESEIASDSEATMDETLVERLFRESSPAVVVITVEGRDGKQSGIGTGFFIRSDGLVATNLHVIGQSRPIKVHLSDGKILEVESVFASDSTMDLAILKVKAKDTPALTIGDSSSTTKGEPIVVIGNPRGLKHSVVSGVLSGTRTIASREMLQLAIPIEPGNSGGPVINAEGEVIGIVTMKSTVTDNLGFAVTINDLKPLLKSPNTVPMSRWLTIGSLNPSRWETLFGASWKQRAGQIQVQQAGSGFGGRSLCLATETLEDEI